MAILPMPFFQHQRRHSTQSDNINNKKDIDPSSLQRIESTSPDMENRRYIYVNLELPASSETDPPTLHHYVSNRIRTAKYTILTFIPKNLFEQFRNIANLYFLLLVILQQIPLLSDSDPASSTLPLIAILILTGAKDAFEDWKRNQSDSQVNSATTRTLHNWRNVNIPVETRGVWFYLFVFLGFFYSLTGIENRCVRCYKMVKRPQRLPSPSPYILSSTSMNENHDATNPSQSSFASENRPIVSSQHPTNIGGRHTQSSCPTRWKEIQWQDLQVGDYVKIFNNECIPADVVVLATSESDSQCYIETQNMDGETNLKVRQGVDGTSNLRTEHDCEHVKFYVESEPPNAGIYQYSGVLRWPTTDSTMDDGVNPALHERSEAITYKNLLLRGCILRNTDWVIGLVVYTGNDTKLLLNSNETPSKRSKMAKGTNPHVIANFVLLATLCIINSVINSTQFYVNGSSMIFDYNIEGSNGVWSGFITFWVTLILYQNIVPISLYITIEIVKSVAAYFIHMDIDLYHEETDTPCIPKTWNISDDLGQIEYIFSDKTGTLTQNVMEFRKCSINGVSYGLTEDHQGRSTSSKNATEKVDQNGPVDLDREDGETGVNDGLDLAHVRTIMIDKQASLYRNPHIGPNPTFVDPRFFDDLAKSDPHAKALEQFFLALALCHSVIAERTQSGGGLSDNAIDYTAESPDEAALVATARDLGFVFLGRQGSTIHTKVKGECKSYDLLHTLEFNSTRKRMSVIIRSHEDPNDNTILFCKGADSIIYERLDSKNDCGSFEWDSKDQHSLRDTCSTHLDRYASEGLRTLCLAYRIIPADEYTLWQQRYLEASSSIVNREEHIEAVCEEVEKNMILMGGTAIEDRLQDGVPETIAELAKSGIKLWVLTGDKTETAINIGFSCNLLTAEMELLVLKATTRDETKAQLLEALERTNDSLAENLALVIDGTTLKYALDRELKDMVLTLGMRSKSVLCCRVSPKQKAQVVQMVKRGLNVMTLAIGDGANDVAMIQEANVGIGISGVEGRQAVMSSDYAIAQFRFLRKLLLVHGRWSYLRTAEMIRGFFFKNIVWTLILFWYQIYCQFNGTMMFEDLMLTLYNLVFTSLPIGFLGAWDQDIDGKTTLRYPELYRMGLRNDIFKAWQFWLAVVDALYQSIVCFFIPYLLLIAGATDPNGHDFNGVHDNGVAVAGIVVFAANFYVAFSMYNFTWIQVFIIALSILVYFLYIGVYSESNDFYYAGQIRLFGTGMYWLVLLLTMVAAFIPRVIITFYQHQYHPYDNDIVREIELVLRSKRRSDSGVDKTDFQDGIELEAR